MRNAKVELIDVALRGCRNKALFIPNSASATTVVATRCEFANSSHGAVIGGSETSATFNNCVFNDNSGYGIFGRESTIHLHGETTAIHSNRGHGIWAFDSGKILIHLPSHHNTLYNNTRGDRRTDNDGTITNVED